MKYGCSRSSTISTSFLSGDVPLSTSPADDAALPSDPTFRQGLRDYIEWATSDVHRYSPRGSVVPGGLTVPQWSWDGLVAGSGEHEGRR